MIRALAHPSVLLAATALFWGGNSVAGKLADGHVSPMLLTLLRWGIASAILLPFGLAALKRDRAAIRAHLPFLFALGASGFAVFNVMLYVALTHTSAINAVIGQSAMPLAVFLAGFVLYRTPVSAAQGLGFALTLVGVAVTAARGSVETLLSLGLNRGDALVLAAIAVYGVYTVALRGKPAIGWLSLMCVLSVSATLASLPFAIGEWLAGGAIGPDARGWAIVIYAAILPSIVAQVFFIRGVEAIGANRAGLFINFVPIFGTLLAVLVAGEALHAYHLVALAFVMGGVALAERGGGKAPPPPRPPP